MSVETGEILAGGDRSASVEETECGDDPLPSTDELLDIVLPQLASAVADLISPSFVLREFELEEIRTSQFRELADRAAEAAEDLRVDEAYVAYKSIQERDPYDPRIAYNLGILNEVVGNYSEAQRLYDLASRLLQEDHFLRAEARAESGAAWKESVRRLGVWIADHDFSVAEEELQQVAAARVLVSGGADERRGVWTDVTDGAPSFLVPGGISLVLMEELEEWFRVELPDGKQGYLPRSAGRRAGN